MVAVGAAALTLAVPSAAAQVGAILIGALIGWRLFPGEPNRQPGRLGFALPKPLAVGSLVAFVVLLVGLQAAAKGGKPASGRRRKTGGTPSSNIASRSAASVGPRRDWPFSQRPMRLGGDARTRLTRHRAGLVDEI